MLLLSRAAKLYQKNGDVLFNAKAWNGRVVMQWLASAARTASLNAFYVAADERLPIVALCMPPVAIQRRGCYF